MASTKSTLSVIVVGAGPVGLLTTLRLAQAGIQTICIDALKAIDDSPRAMAYHPIATKELDRAGVLADVRRRGGSSGRSVCWRQIKDGEVIARLERSVSKDFPYENLVIGQHELAAIIMEHLQRFENAKVVFGRRVTAIEDQADVDVKVTTVDEEGKEHVSSASYLVAADGGRSTIRRLLGISFDGFTYREQLVSTNVYFDFDKYGWEDANFCIDPEHWGLIARINDKGLWRVSYGELDGLDHAQLMERLPWKFATIFPGPSPPAYKLEQFSPYRLNQRCASTFRKGRVLLAGDAAHLCNPFGGLGLTGGLLDAAAVSDALIGIHEGKAGDAIMDRYAEVRRSIFLDTVDPSSQSNKKRMQDPDPSTVGERDPFLKALREADAEQKQQIRAHAKLAVDMSEFFDKREGSAEARL
ncbi:hypothetical protein LTR36_000385 [Oleoguttula mirabilis]|uniref:FAD-binding domain-containing protein n=1 Tax=Oleoguttula mirabilis TaxID=1507867 RepID=A0AAV9JYV6_9PEZI|nr:hypothetical protein LTR36_000385 [Oleoguttula mirabilis]